MSEKNTAESFVFYSSFLDVARILPGRNFERFVLAILEYGLYGTEPNFDEFSREARLAAKGSFMQIKVGIDSSKRRYTSCVENGKKGGAKIGNQNARKRPKNDQRNDLKTTNETTKETTKGRPRNDLNYNGNDNALGNYHYLKGTDTPSSEPHGSAPSPVPAFEPYTMEQAIADIEAKAAAKRERERIAEEAKKEEWRKLDEQREKERAERLAKAAELRRMAEEQMTAKEAEVSAG